MPVIDTPFGSYEESPEQAFRNASRLMAETGAPAVKLEGGQHMAETIAFLSARGVPVMAHVGLTPQAVNTSWRLQGGAGRKRRRRSRPTPARSRRPAPSRSCWKRCPRGWPGGSPRTSAIPTIGIGAGARCDGQVLVVDDMLGLSLISGRNSCVAMPNWARPPTRRSPPMPPMSARAPSRRPSIPSPMSSGKEMIPILRRWPRSAPCARLEGGGRKHRRSPPWARCTTGT